MTLEMGISLHRVPTGEHGGGLFTRDTETRMKEGYGNGTPMGVLRGEPGGRAPLLETLKIYKGRLWRQASPSIGTPLGKFIYLGTTERQ